MSVIVQRLRFAREQAWPDLQPAFDHAIALACEAEYQADKAANEAQCAVRPAYPPLVSLLAQSVEHPDDVIVDAEVVEDPKPHTLDGRCCTQPTEVVEP